MTKDVSTNPETEQEEAIIRVPHATNAYALQSKADTKTVIVAVGVSVVLFAIGLILGYLLGRQTTDTDRGQFENTMMNGGVRNLQMRAQNQTTTTQSTTGN